MPSNGVHRSMLLRRMQYCMFVTRRAISLRAVYATSFHWLAGLQLWVSTIVMCNVHVDKMKKKIFPGGINKSTLYIHLCIMRVLPQQHYEV